MVAAETPMEVSMKFRLRSFICGLVVAFCSMHLAKAGPDECREATDQYLIIASAVGDALAAYEMCFFNSLGQDDCALEFSNLQAAQADFEIAVAAYRDECQ
jgi:hypothetical protein